MSATAVLKSSTYAAVTPARDEEENLSRLAEAMLAQTIKPERWVIVENGSGDGTAALAAKLAETHSWITLLQTRGSRAYDRTSPYMRAFHAGVESLHGGGDVVVKLDADVSMEPDFFERILTAFATDPRLGITSGILFERDGGGVWREREIFGHHCWGPTRAYRRACLDVVLPLDDGISYAVVDLAKAELAGFRTGAIQDLPFLHHRPEGGRQSAWTSWHEQGEAAHYVGYRLSYLLARSAYRSLREDPAAVALIAGYMRAALERRSRYGNAGVVAALRESQRPRRVLQSLRASRERPPHAA
jgi:poly-beta-1,6-N-acetyl-D-glucosamine synthase